MATPTKRKIESPPSKVARKSFTCDLYSGATYIIGFKNLLRLIFGSDLYTGATYTRRNTVPGCASHPVDFLMVNSISAFFELTMSKAMHF